MSRRILSSRASFSSQLFITLLYQLTSVYAAPQLRRGLNIDNSPGPPPDRQLLTYQVAGIVGSYALVAITALTLLLVLGRRLRKETLAEPTLYRMEIARPYPNGTTLGVGKDISPVSPTKQNWESPTDSDTTYLYPSPVSPTTAANRSWTKPSGVSQRTIPSQNGSVVTFDDRVLEADRARAQTDLETLYAAVALHEDEKEERRGDMGRDEEPNRAPSLRSPRQDTFPGLPSSPRPQNQSFSTLASPRQEQFGMHALASPRQDQFPSAMLSPQQAQFAPLASPQYAQYPYGQMPLSPGQLSHPMAPTPVNPLSPPLSPKESRLSKANPLSFFSSRKSRSSDKTDSFRISLKGLPISEPLGSARHNNSVGMPPEDGPMSPRVYAPGPPPPTPGHYKTDLSVMPTIPQSAEPSPQPQFQLSKPPTASRAAPPTPLTLGTSNVDLSGTSTPNRSTGALPLRNYGPAPPQSAPFTRLQFADRRESRIAPGPKTGMPYPHSPYMPFSPVTPVSASIKTGKELKLAKKIARKMEATEMVKDSDEIWGS